MSVYPEKRNGQLTGTWLCEVEVAGKRLRSRHATKAEADAVELRIKAPVAVARSSNVIELSRAPRVTKATPKLNEFYLEVRDVLWGAARTRDEVFKLAEDAISAMGNPVVSEITKGHLNKLVSKWMAEGKGAKRIKNLLVPIGRLLREAEDYGYCNAPSLPVIEGAERKRSSVLSHEDEAKLLAWLRAEGQEEIADLFELLAITGCRVGELLAAIPSWLKSDAHGSFLQLPPEVCKNKEGRQVRLDGRGLELAKARLPFGILYNRCQFWFAKAREAVGITDTDICIHALRHTAATRLLNEKGEDIRVVQEFLGHKTIGQTQRYTEVDASRLAKAASAMGRKA